MDKPKVLLHICCGVCAGWAIEKLKSDGYSVTGYFYNPNIEPHDEYRLRLNAAIYACRVHGIPLVEGAYDNSRWQGLISGFEQEPEGGMRCRACYACRLAATAAFGKEQGFSRITTTLTISPHKDAAVINEIGKNIAPQAFLLYNLKKEEGFKKSNDFARENNLYRQHYCGCRYSMRPATKGR